MNEQPPSLWPLTAFRFFAALAVFLHHVGHYCALDPVLTKLYRSVFYEGFSGVSFFFVLSGFILSYNYHRVFTALRWREVWNFYAARFARIYPVHALTFVAMLPLWYADFQLAPGTASLQAVANLTLIQSFIPRRDYYFSGNAPSWSLSDEFFFYALLPLIVCGLGSLRLAKPARSGLATIGLLSVAFALAWGCRNRTAFHWLCYINPLCRVADFAAGVTLCLTYLGLRQSLSGTTGRTAATVLELASLAGLGVAVWNAPAIPFGVRLGSYYTPAMAAIIFIFAFQRGYLSALLSTQLFWILGEISFSFYMFHMVILRYLAAYGSRFGLDQCSPRTTIVLALCVALVLSGLCHYGFERPMRERLKRWLIRDCAERGRGASVSAVPQLRQAA